MPPLSMAPSRLLPIASLLPQDGSCILSAPAGLEPEDHLRQTCVFCPGCAGDVSGSCAKIVLDLEAGVISGYKILMTGCATKDLLDLPGG